MKTSDAVVIGILCLSLAGCSGSAGPVPTAPSAVPSPTGPFILLAGNSNAYFLVPYLPEALDYSMLDASIDYWLNHREFAERARAVPLLAFVWSQSGPDAVRMPPDEYSQKLRTLITIVRANSPTLPIRIIEVPERPDRVLIKAAQRQVATDPGVELIPTGDLEMAADGNHFTHQGYQTIRDRIYRSLGR
jgi:hypothetical protein